ncbi:threonine ammonia-lyase [Synchytrium microbalum]|uniref:Threonine dehydratase n=1 Tax=Synchytrium microbalum TaxID=1806994 RepID=A0A507CBH3_9FUNG|nr:threonine ammonia-lyase [Synchytrium microbalum]TPX34893.1 threonine ammonia-lyase [Synchytrium microbalum]
MVAFQPPPPELTQSGTQTRNIVPSLQSRATSTLAPQTAEIASQVVTSVGDKATQYHPIASDATGSSSSTQSVFTPLPSRQQQLDPLKRTASPMLSPSPRFEDDPGSPFESSIYHNPNRLSDAECKSQPSEGLPDYLNMILTARVYDVAIESQLQVATNLSARMNNTILFKREDTQPVFSFKLRGAYNRMMNLSPAEREKGVIACSAGNHAQGVALSAQKMGIKATIVMPMATPPIKWRNVKRLGAEVVLYGNDFDEAKIECARLSLQEGKTNIPPFDDPYVIAGQGTIALEILRQYNHTEIDAIFICVGGGGLLAGIASYIKRINPKIKIIGVETFDADAMTRSLKAGQRVVLPEVGLFADGTAVRQVGEETFRLAQDYVDDMILVSTDELCAAIKDVFLDTRSVLEPAGALGVAGIKKYVGLTGCTGKTFIAIASGANMNFDRLRFVAERAELGEFREALISVTIPEQPGAFMKLYKTVAPRAVTEFSYRYSDDAKAHIIMSFAVSGPAETVQVISNLTANGMNAYDISQNEMAKAHARYLVGGRSSSVSNSNSTSGTSKGVENERLFRFSFPERPGALEHFLASLKSEWNVSLFHYRNYGGDVGKVMVAIQVPPETNVQFDAFLSDLKYPYVEETSNAVYQQFLR